MRHSNDSHAYVYSKSGSQGSLSKDFFFGGVSPADTASNCAFFKEFEEVLYVRRCHTNRHSFFCICDQSNRAARSRALYWQAVPAGNYKSRLETLCIVSRISMGWNDPSSMALTIAPKSNKCQFTPHMPGKTRYTAAARLLSTLMSWKQAEVTSQKLIMICFKTFLNIL